MMVGKNTQASCPGLSVIQLLFIFLVHPKMTSLSLSTGEFLKNILGTFFIHIAK